MSRSLSLSALDALNAQETGEVFLILLTIDHPSLSAPLRVTHDRRNTESRGEVFVAFPFDLELPEDSETLSAQARLSIDNIDRSIVAALRSIDGAPSVLLEVVRAADPDTVEAAFPDFRLTNVQYDALGVTGDLSIEDFTAEPYPAAVFSPSGFPGLF
ncbi:MAG: DUF1833 domain-containing protein [Micavibrio sp.]|nr:MAG: DUF1833 domain-containing protein [Micavibrio sp.]